MTEVKLFFGGSPDAAEKAATEWWANQTGLEWIKGTAAQEGDPLKGERGWKVMITFRKALSN